MIFEAEERIAQPASVVWRHLTEPALMALWMTGIENLATPDDGPLNLDSTLTFKARGSERTSRVVEYERGKLITLRSVQHPFTATYRYRLHPDGGDPHATIVTLDADCAARGWGVILVPLIRPLIRKADQGQLARLNDSIRRTATG